jgi:hypothetical protein
MKMQAAGVYAAKLSDATFVEGAIGYAVHQLVLAADAQILSGYFIDGQPHIVVLESVEPREYIAHTFVLARDDAQLDIANSKSLEYLNSDRPSTGEYRAASRIWHFFKVQD